MTTTPDADRQARRTAVTVLLARISARKVLTYAESEDLRFNITADQIDGDQAREQLAAAERDHNTRRVDLTQALGERMDLPWPTLLGAVRTTVQARANLRDNLRLIRDTHETHRKALAEALGCFPTTRWADLPSIATTRIEQRQRAEKRAEAAEAGERRAMEQRQQMAAERYAWQERGDRAEISARAHKTAATEALERAEAAEATVRDYENRLSWETTCGEHARLLDSCRAAEERAERAEATLTAVRALHARTNARRAYDLSLHPIPTCSGCGEAWPCPTAAALGDPQPATKPEAPPERCCVCGCPDVTYHNHRDQPFCCRCAKCCDPPLPCAHGCQPPAEAETAPEHGWAPATCRRMNTRTCPPTGPCPGPCARFESEDPTPWEQTAEPETEQPTVSVIDALAADLIAAVRRAITTITKD